MNESFNKLIIQAIKEVEPVGTVRGDKDAILQKFAELIVRECADIGQQYADGNYEVYNQILEHFGIEEE